MTQGYQLIINYFQYFNPLPLELSSNSFDFLESLSKVSGRALCAVMTICFDKNNTSESSRAKQCHDESVRLLLEHGYVLYRAGNQSMKLLDETDTFMQLLKNKQSKIH
jgi:hypothetical protein